MHHSHYWQRIRPETRFNVSDAPHLHRSLVIGTYLLATGNHYGFMPDNNLALVRVRLQTYMVGSVPQPRIFMSCIFFLLLQIYYSLSLLIIGWTSCSGLLGLFCISLVLWMCKYLNIYSIIHFDQIVVFNQI